MIAVDRLVRTLNRQAALPRALSAEPIFAAALALVLALLVFPPLLFMLQTSLLVERGVAKGSLTLAHYSAVLENILSGAGILINSFVFSAGSAVVALLLGGSMAWLSERTNAPFRTAAYVAAFISFAIPGVIKVIAWILLLGPNAGFINVALMSFLGLEEAPLNIFTLGGMVFLEGLLWAPIVFLLLAAPFRSMDPSLEDAAAMSGAGTLKTLYHVTLKLAMPTVLTVLMLTFIRSLEAFEIPALIGIPANVEVFTTKIYLQIGGSGFLQRYGEASAYATVLVALILLLLIPYYRMTRHAERFATITGKGFRPRILDLGRWRYAGGVILVLLPFLEVLPLFVMTYASLLPFIQPPSLEALQSLTLENYPRAFGNTNILVSIGNTAVVTTVSATAVVLLALVTSWAVQRTGVRWRWLLDQIATVPLIFPGIVLGLAVLRTFLNVPLPVYGTVWILVIAYLTRYLPYGMRFGYAGLLSIHRELEESAEVSGARWLQRMGRIVVPLMLPTLSAAWIYVFLVTTRELSAALLLASPGNQVLSVTIWELWTNGQVTDLSAFAVAVTLVLIGISFGLYRLTGGKSPAV